MIIGNYRIFSVIMFAVLYKIIERLSSRFNWCIEGKPKIHVVLRTFYALFFGRHFYINNNNCNLYMNIIN